MSIPIIGQQAKVKDWNLTIAVECMCGNEFLFAGKPACVVEAPGMGPVVTQPGHIVVCMKCKRMYQIVNWPERDAMTGDLALSFAVKVPPQEEGK